MKLTKALLAGASIVAFGATAGFAGDTNDNGRKKVVAADPFFKSGIFGGAQVGWSHIAGDLTMQRAGTADVKTKPSGNGVTFGAFAGYRHVMGNIVAGAETGFNFDTASGKKKNVTFGGVTDNKTTLKSTWHAPVQALAGMIFAEKFLGYVKAGANFKNVKVRHDSASTGRNKKSRVAIGFMPGVGAEMAFGGGLSARAEFNYEIYGGKTHAMGGTAPNVKVKNLNAFKLSAGGVYAI